MVTLQFLKKILRTMAIIVVAIGTSSPVTTFAAPVRSDVVSDIQAHIDVSSLTSRFSKPTISGTATGRKKLKVTVYKEDTTRSVFKKSTVKVSREEWNVKVSKKLSDGNYTVVVEGVNVKGVKNIIATETLVVNTKGDSTVSSSSKSVLLVGSIPLLSGGNAQAGATVPISYLQVNNTGKESISLKGFWIAQNGSAQTESVIGLSVVDDQSMSRGFVGGNEGTVPTTFRLEREPLDLLHDPRGWLIWFPSNDLWLAAECKQTSCWNHPHRPHCLNE